MGSGTPLVECVPNFSEGRDASTIAALRAALESVSGVRMLDIQSDRAHNRSVFTFAASPATAAEAVFRAMRVARDRIDLREHRGEHPRMGATDVVPFVPLAGTTMPDCVRLAHALGERVGRELEIPVFLYAEAATRPERKSLPAIRKGEFEGLRERIGTDPAADPDYGPKRIHPSAGATAIGARPFLVAYNIYLDTSDVAVAREIAKQIRTSSGGLPGVQASGFDVDGKAQVSMNLLDVDVTPPATVFAAVAREAANRGVGVLRSEVVGLIPERALLGAAAAAVKLADPAAHVLEAKILEAERRAERPSLDAWIHELAQGTPTPGGGSAAALAGALAAALVAMVARLTTGRKAYAAVQDRVAVVITEADALRTRLLDLVDEDAAAYGRVTAAYRLPSADPGRAAAINSALLGAADPPAEVARHAARLGDLAREMGRIGNKNAAADAAVAAALARAAFAGALENVRVNLAGLSNTAPATTILEELERLARDATAATSRDTS